ncbi:hypothetical protein CPB84DRAFT_1678379 [Gymnopilus junonius]|uniref:Reverse transcriptase zinc-binding domain-containing protein n=1 Tax=Gymnopilus junonius TaxID=109634 RepID=A0A9P5NQK9_GYMJU|nr:hypothetical protein CPB84DRAFT_1678379 [Gymnopilus junonius]
MIEDQGCVGLKDKQLFQATMAALRSRRKKVKVTHVVRAGNNNRRGHASTLANEGALKPEADVINVETDLHLKITGAKLNKMTQALAYKLIREKAMEKYMKRRQTEENIALIRTAAKESFGKLPSPSAIWKSIRQKDISRNIRYFLWMTIHNAYMVGRNWERPGFSPDFQQHSKCTVCNVTESMEHILTQCEATGQAEVWRLAKELWEKKSDIPFPNINIGTILASPSAQIGTKGESRLFRIIMTESAHQIWKHRCKRVVQEEDAPTKHEVARKWIDMINRRLELDCHMTHPKYEKKALSKAIVLLTWERTLLNEENLPLDWTREAGVLVGIQLQEDDGRGRDRRVGWM